MRDFALLWMRLEGIREEEDQIALLRDYFNNTDRKNINDGLALLLGKYPKRVISQQKLFKLTDDILPLPRWLIETCKETVGDNNEAAANLLPFPAEPDKQSLKSCMDEIRQASLDKAWNIEGWVTRKWQGMLAEERYFFNKVITSSFRFSIPEKIIAEALVGTSALNYYQLFQLLTADWSPGQCPENYFLNAEIREEKSEFPYSFAGIRERKRIAFKKNWLVATLFPGIRVQLLVKGDVASIWTEEGVLLSHKVPEIIDEAREIGSDFVLEGRLMAFHGLPLPKDSLLQRLKRKPRPAAKTDIPVIFLAYDLLSYENKDIRGLSFSRRFTLLEGILSEGKESILLADLVQLKSKEHLKEIRMGLRMQGAEEVMIQDAKAVYDDNEAKSCLKAPVLKTKLVLLYAEEGREGLMLTFALIHGDELFPFVKATAGFDEDELSDLRIFIKENTIEKFGPVRSLNPTEIFELAMDGIFESRRKKCGIDAHGIRILRWLRTAGLDEATELKAIRKYLPVM